MNVEATTERPPLLDVEDLTVEFATRRGTVRAVQHVSVRVAKGETVGIVGESGSGKSVTSYAVMRILDRAGRIAEGSIMFGGIDVRNAPESEVRQLRGREISMIFQNPRAALNPIRKVGKQIEDILLEHVQAVPADVKEKAIEALRRVRIANPEERYHAYPFELSGGMCQRVVIALALACQPELLIADEPTTGLDVTTQKAVMDLVVELTRERGMSTILITHDLGLAAAYCDRVVVMEKGKVVETAPSRQIFAAPEHAYTKKLMRATPRLGIGLRDLLPADADHTPIPQTAAAGSRRSRCSSSRTSSRNTSATRCRPRFQKMFGRKQEEEAKPFRAVGGISFEVKRGESVGLVGESGCGKSTTSMMVMRLIDKTSGAITFGGEDIGAIPAKQFAVLPARKRIQMVFQDPTDSLNPRFTAVRAIADPLMRLGHLSGGDALRAKCEDLARQVGLPLELLDRFPASALRRAEGESGHRSRHRAQAGARHSRRADRRARRVGAGGGAQPPRRLEGGARHELSLRLPRPQRGAAAVRPGHRHAFRPDRGAGDLGGGARLAQDRVHARAAGGDPGAAALNGRVGCRGQRRRR